MRTSYNFALIYFARFLPSLALKRFLYRTVGAKIGKGSAFAPGSVIDFFWPELITVGEDALIGYNTVILGHELLQDEYRTGKVEIGKNTMIGANCTILPGVKIGDNASVSAMSLVNRDVPAGQKWGGIPIKRID